MARRSKHGDTFKEGDRSGQGRRVFNKKVRKQDKRRQRKNCDKRRQKRVGEQGEKGQKEEIVKEIMLITQLMSILIMLDGERLKGSLISSVP